MKVSCPIFQFRVLCSTPQEYHKDGLSYIAGKRGENFELEISNLTMRRILAHPTVDGLSVMTGKETSRLDSSHGYILRPLQKMVVPGWRLTDSEVAQFFFAGNGKSYAEKVERAPIGE